MANNPRSKIKSTPRKRKLIPNETNPIPISKRKYLDFFDSSSNLKFMIIYSLWMSVISNILKSKIPSTQIFVTSYPDFKKLFLQLAISQKTQYIFFEIINHQYATGFNILMLQVFVIFVFSKFKLRT